MSSYSDLQAQIRKAEVKIDLADAYTRLQRNPDFKKLVSYLDSNRDALQAELCRHDQLSQEYRRLLVGLTSLSYMSRLLGLIVTSGAAAQDEVRQARRLLGESDED